MSLSSRCRISEKPCAGPLRENPLWAKRSSANINQKSRRLRNYLFDVFPLLCWLQEEPGYELIDDLLTEAETGKSSISMHIINLGEVFYRICRVSGIKQGEEILDKIRHAPY